MTSTTTTEDTAFRLESTELIAAARTPLMTMPPTPVGHSSTAKGSRSWHHARVACSGSHCSRALRNCHFKTIEFAQNAMDHCRR